MIKKNKYYSFCKAIVFLKGICELQNFDMRILK